MCKTPQRAKHYGGSILRGASATLKATMIQALSKVVAFGELHPTFKSSVISALKKEERFSWLVGE